MHQRALAGPGDARDDDEHAERYVDVHVLQVVGRRAAHFDRTARLAHGLLELRAVVEPAVEQLVWYVDGRPFRTVDAPFETRWPLEPGEHSFQARLPWGDVRSAAVRVRVD